MPSPMWLPGHVSVAFLLCLPLLLVSMRRGVPIWLALSYIGLFSVLPDFFHIGDYRMVSHSIIGLALIAGVILYPLGRLLKADSVLLAIGSVAAGSHLAADLWIGHIYPYFPFSEMQAEINQFNTLYDLRTEILLSLVAFIILALLLYATRSQWLETQPTVTPLEKVHTLLIALPFAAMCLGQLVVFFETDLQGQFTATAAAMVPLIIGPLVAASAYVLAVGRKRIRIQPDIPA
jgi:hypothetical protein